MGGTPVRCHLTSLVAELRAAICDDADAACQTIHDTATRAAATCLRVVPRGAPDAGRSYRVIVGDREITLPAGNILGRSKSAIRRQLVSPAARPYLTADGAPEWISGQERTSQRSAGHAPTTLDGALIVLGTTALKFRIFETPDSTETVTR